MLAGCGSADGGAASSAPSSSAASGSPPVTETTAVALSGKATCDRLVGGGYEALGLRVADFTVELMNGEEIDNVAYATAQELTGELDELAEVADSSYADVIEDVKAGPEAVVNAVSGGGGSFTIPAQEMMQASLDAGEECLSGPALDAYASALSARIDQLPLEYGGNASAQAEEQCLESMRVGIVADNWDSVVASIGARDHLDIVEEFYDRASDLSDDSKSGCAGGVELALLAYEAAILRAAVAAEGWGEYEDVREALEQWLTAIDRTDIEVAAP